MKKIRWRLRYQLQKKMGVYEERLLEQQTCETMPTGWADGVLLLSSVRNLTRLIDEQKT